MSGDDGRTRPSVSRPSLFTCSLFPWNRPCLHDMRLYLKRVGRFDQDSHFFLSRLNQSGEKRGKIVASFSLAHLILESGFSNFSERKVSKNSQPWERIDLMASRVKRRNFLPLGDIVQRPLSATLPPSLTLPPSGRWGKGGRTTLCRNEQPG